MISAAIFDVDGTLFDSMQLWRNFGCNYLVRRGKSPDIETEKAVRYMSLYEAACHFKNDCGISGTVEEIEADCNRMLEDYYFNKIKLKDGVRELLKFLSGNNIPTAIATATDRYLVDAALRREGIREYFSVIATCPEVGHGKDRPDVFFEAQKALDARVCDTWVFEDALHAVKTAKSAGYHVLAVYDETESDHAQEICSLSDIYVKSFSSLDKNLLINKE